MKNIPNPFFFEYILVGYTNKQNVARITIPISANITTIFNIGNTTNATPVNIYKNIIIDIDSPIAKNIEDTISSSLYYI